MKRYFYNIIFTHFFLLLVVLSATAQQHTLKWYVDHENQLGRMYNPGGLFFEDAMFDEASGLPVFPLRMKMHGQFETCQPVLINPVFEALSAEEMALLPEGYHPDTIIQFHRTSVQMVRKQAYVFAEFYPFRLNAINSEVEKLISFDAELHCEGIAAPKSHRTYASQSVLSTGDWVKLRIEKQGVYKITYEELAAEGLSVEGVHPSRIRMFGNGNAMLPERTDLLRPDDLGEIAIKVVTADPDSFKPGDFILFYAASPHQWQPILDPLNLRFEHTWNIYSNYSYYFLTISDAEGKRVQDKVPVHLVGSHQVRTFSDYQLYKPDINNIVKLGREWFGERIPGNSSITSPVVFTFTNLDTTQDVRIRSRFAVKANELSRIKLDVNDQVVLGPNVTGIPPGIQALYARLSTFTALVPVKQPEITIDVTYLNNNTSASAWADYVEINARRHMTYPGEQLSFRDLASVGSNYTGQFMLSNPPEDVIVWEVTSKSAPENVVYRITENGIDFTFPTPILREFVAFTLDNVHRVDLMYSIPNQNLHGMGSSDMIIISPEKLWNEAERYAEIRRKTSDLTVQVVNIDHIFNEFSSGSLDPTAIRDFMKMLYNRAAPGDEPKYLLLFGDGSYDPKDRLTDNNNLIPTFQSVESMRIDLSFVTDDFYGILDDGEGENGGGAIDIGVGRFPVLTVEEANGIINKVEYYIHNREINRGKWQNSLTFVAHDEDKDVHFVQAEELAQYVEDNHKVFNIEKIYLDAYQRDYIPSGFRYPDANQAINEAVENGTMLINYIGHGGETGWATSQVLTNNDILAWKNIDNMPLFLTATCSFGRFDNPELLSAGELVVKNPDGGGIALFTTSRLAYSSFNFRLNKSFTKFMFQRNADGSYHTLGDLIRLSKNDNDNNVYIRNFLLLGDPSLQILFPDHNVVTAGIYASGSDEPVNDLLGLSEFTITGHIADFYGNKMSDFNGVIYPVVYDKPEQYITLANDPGSQKRPFNVQYTILHKGKASVTNGEFSFNFVVPRDVRPMLDKGKISYFATNGTYEAHGYYNSFNIGGLDPSTTPDMAGPEISMYLNDASFVFGGSVNDTPILYADLHDPQGINFFGLGIGHDIVAYLNEETSNPIILNDFFSPVLDSHTTGEIVYQFGKLAEGKHTLRLKAWDLHNNSTEAYTEFYVTSALEVVSGNLYNYPNPFSNGTYIVFEHNYTNKDIKVTVDIFTLTGQMINRLGPMQVSTSGSTIEPVYWDGTSDNGSPVNTGLYIYKILIQASDDFQDTLQGKMLLIR